MQEAMYSCAMVLNHLRHSLLPATTKKHLLQTSQGILYNPILREKEEKTTGEKTKENLVTSLTFN